MVHVLERRRAAEVWFYSDGKPQPRGRNARRPLTPSAHYMVSLSLEKKRLICSSLRILMVITVPSGP